MYELPKMYWKGWILLEAKSGVTLDLIDHISHHNWCIPPCYLAFWVIRTNCQIVSDNNMLYSQKRRRYKQGWNLACRTSVTDNFPLEMYATCSYSKFSTFTMEMTEQWTNIVRYSAVVNHFSKWNKWTGSYSKIRQRLRRMYIMDAAFTKKAYCIRK